MNFNAAMGAMNLLAGGGANDAISAMGITKTDYDVVTGPTKWVASQRTIVTKTLDALLYGVMDLVGVPRFECPAEYISAGIAMFVHPTNVQAGCRWMEGGTKVDTLALDEAEAGGTRVPCKAPQLFALVLKIQENSTELDDYKARFEKKSGLAMTRANKAKITA